MSAPATTPLAISNNTPTATNPVLSQRISDKDLVFPPAILLPFIVGIILPARKIHVKRPFGLHAFSRAGQPQLERVAGVSCRRANTHRLRG
jgi:hypothetical protein